MKKGVKSQNYFIIYKYIFMENREIIITEHVQQMCKHQDYTISGETEYRGESIKYAAVFDGHGSNIVIDFIRQISLEKMQIIMSSDMPGRTMFNYIVENVNLSSETNTSSGSTMCLARVFKNYIEITNIGDSQAVVYKNGQVNFISTPHNYNNKKEMQRLISESRILDCSETNGIKMIGANKIVSVMNNYIRFKLPNYLLIISQSLGHNGITGVAPDITIIPYNLNDTNRVILGSDGFFDMIIKEKYTNRFVNSDLLEIADYPGQVILNRAVERWTQEWNCLEHGEIREKCRFTTTECDDISLVVVDVI